MNREIFFVGGGELTDNTLYKQSTINECIKWLNTLDEVNLDTETEGFFNHENKIVMLQLYYKDITYILDVRYINILPLKERLENILVVGQNLKFDFKFLKFHGIELNNIYDTFLVECLLTNGLRDRELGLDALVQKYCNEKLDKTIRNQFINLKGQPFTNSQIVYGSKDVSYLSEIKEKQLVEVSKWKLEDVVNLENQACLALADIEYNGLLFDSESWIKVANKAKENIKNYEEELDNIVLQESKLKKFLTKGEQLALFGIINRKVAINYDSPTQMLKVFKALGLDVLNSGEKEIQKYQSTYPFVKKFIDYKKDSKLVSTYGLDFLKWINKNTNRIHTEFWQILETNRVSSNNPNLQNLPAKNEYLNCFIAEKGYKILGIDYSGQEARIAATGSKDEMWVKTFNEDKDLHSEVCKLMFGITDDLVKTKPDFLRGKSYRDVAKTINFGALFGMSEFKLSKTLVIPVEEAKELLIKYFKATKQLKGYLDACAAYGLKNGYIRSYKPYSGIRWFPDWKANLDKYQDSKIIGEITRACYNSPVQATGASMTKRALVLLRKYIKDNNLTDKVKLVHVVHDAIYTEVREEYVQEFSKIQSDIMIQAAKEFNLLVPMKTDISINDCWSK